MNEINEILDAMQARCDGATAGPWILDGWQIWHDLGERYPGFTGVEASKNCRTEKSKANLTFAVHARQDIPTLAKMLLRAIEALEKCGQCCNELANTALADINALAAKGSQ